MPYFFYRLFVVLMAVIMPTNAFAAVDSGDTAWILTATALVLFMTLPGLALFYAGLVQSKNVVSVLMHHFTVACLMSVLWVVAGYSLAFSGIRHGLEICPICLWSRTVESVSGTIPESLFGAFQMTFAVITPALIIGAYVERIKFSAVLIFSSLAAGGLRSRYPLGVGWRHYGQLGCYGFCRRHCCSRHGRNGGIGCCYRDCKRRSFPSSVQPPHSPILTMIGACMLWVGWFGLTAALFSSRPKCINGSLGNTYFCSCRLAGLDDN